MPHDYIYRDYSCKLSKGSCVKLLQALAVCKGSITSNFTIAGGLPEATVSRWSMFFKLRFSSQEDVDLFHNLGFITTVPERVVLFTTQEQDLPKTGAEERQRISASLVAYVLNESIPDDLRLEVLTRLSENGTTGVLFDLSEKYLSQQNANLQGLTEVDIQIQKNQPAISWAKARLDQMEKLGYGEGATVGKVLEYLKTATQWEGDDFEGCLQAVNDARQ